MSLQYQGIENVNPEELAKQRALTKALWESLVKKGWKSGTTARIECYFFAPDSEAATALGMAFSDWEPEVADSDDGKKAVRMKTEPVRLTSVALLELVDVLMISAQEYACTFDGFQIETTALQQKKPWWKLW